ncbi:chalcone and stilbene synthase domain protein [Kribbella flavida DSM 17836]|uniref:Chalcone and stilbene synthase domain protein n=1 Tax=Kribbella flavida (strain DSM 17836 / JCM 10339 / NBRC 14399) TaxID=479435 RepID=D2PWG6_KRIFD|nr:stilbene synthase [Kribbella flavida]ADB31618.1 chalcone and stilbene synthase domain protein [Kribbella flavida DSM 17836]
MTRIAAVQPALPPYRYAQAELTDAFAELCLPDGKGHALLRRLHANAGVSHRNLAIPLEQYAELKDFGAANDAWIAMAVDLGAEAIAGALATAGLGIEDVDLLLFTTVTGLAAPSIDARVATRLGMREDVKRLPLFGLGCVGGAAGIARLHDYLTAWPSHVAVLLSVELCSLTLQRDDSSLPNLVGGALFGDGAAAVVMTGAEVEGTGPSVVATRSRLYPDSERVMGWDVGAGGFRIVLGADVPEVVRKYLGDDVAAFLAGHELTVPEIGTWVSHPGGPKVLEAVSETLKLRPGALDLTWKSLDAVGNLSSSSVLHVLGDTMTLDPAGPGLLLAMGPGFCSELVLLEW